MIIEIHKDKIKRCYNKNMKWHNVYGPDEIRSDGYKLYCINGEFHNPNGPAAIYPNGNIEYWLDGIIYSKERWKELRHGY